MSNRYIDDVLAGDAFWTDADDYVARWHSSESPEELHEFLGLTWEEYALWTERPESLRLIIAAREYEEPIAVLLERQDELAVAARGLDSAEAEAVQAWLKKTGRLS